ncbi:MAG TPA: Smr/MutS family protein [Candidatus Binataceae bacterium]
MAKKRKSTPQSKAAAPSENAEKPIFASPFKDLKKLIEQRAAEVRPAPPPPPKPKATPAPLRTSSISQASAPAPQQVDDETLFREAFEGVRPLGLPRAQRLAVAPQARREIVSEDAEVLAELSDLVSGQGNFELTETEEYVEGARHGLDPRLLSQLRRGEFSIQAHLDLHGMIQPDAKEALTEFIVDSVRKGRRTVLIVHGRGLRSPGGLPVLKHAAAQWLSHGIAGGYVLAFATARPSDGGAGAVYVMLRRERRRAKFDVLQGAKRRD